MLASKFLKNVVTGYPLKLVASQVDVLEPEPNDDNDGSDSSNSRFDFVKRMMPKLDYGVLKNAADSIGYEQLLPGELKQDWENDQDLMNNLHKALLQIEIVEGYLECPETGRKFPIRNGIPNMLANEDEVV
uniref:Multifunctional methyltransferase subunit TRM112-like protein n=1 Tax=Romanomermis culicivorax TaxID=13658 RepID=A0A915I3U2_ROMCU